MHGVSEYGYFMCIPIVDNAAVSVRLSAENYATSVTLSVLPNEDKYFALSLMEAKNAV